MNLLETKGLTRRFGGLVAVDNVDFALPQGQIRAIIGPNGAGKSTFVGLVCGRISASSGEVFFNNRNVTGLPAHARIAMHMAYTFQITSIFSRLSLHENVALAVRRQMSGDPSAVDEAVLSALDKVGLKARAHDIAGDLSYGHQRLLEVAMGIAQKPKLLILDEPTQGLSEAEVVAFNQLIGSMGGTTTILLIEHNMNVVMQVAEYITVLNFGAVLAEGTPEDVRANEQVQAAYLGAG